MITGCQFFCISLEKIYQDLTSTISAAGENPFSKVEDLAKQADSDEAPLEVFEGSPEMIFPQFLQRVDG